MKLVAKPMIYHFTSIDVVAIFLYEEYESEIINQIIPELSFIKDKMDLSSFTGKSSESMFIPLKDYPNIILIGIGKRKKITKESLRENSTIIMRVCKKRKVSTVHVVLPELDDLEELNVLSSIAEGLSLSDYVFEKYKTKEENGNLHQEIEEAHFYCDRIDEATDILKEISIITKNTHLCRNLVNETSEISNPVAISKEAKSIAKLKGVKCKVYGEKEIERLKLGLLLAVSRGSKLPPQLVTLKYSGDPGSKKQIAIVGKGITFDSGGMNLKPSSSIEDMRSDMAGAAACLYAIKAAAELKLKKNILAVIPLCENMISNNAYRAGDIFTAFNGKNVEVGNTDAEGRLILADAISFTEKKLKPDYIIDIATLTGACLVCFGETIAALLSTNDKLADLIYKAGEETGDQVWRLPFHKDYDDMLKSDAADIKNIGAGRSAGTIIGASFLKDFITEAPWAHIDIAGTSWYSKARGYRPKHATGFGVRLFVELFKTIDI